MRISDWSSDVCSSDLRDAEAARRDAGLYPAAQAVRYPDREIPGPPAPHGRHVHGGGAGTLDDDHAHAEARPARKGAHDRGIGGAEQGRAVGKVWWRASVDKFG